MPARTFAHTRGVTITNALNAGVRELVRYRRTKMIKLVTGVALRMERSGARNASAV